MWGGNVEVSNGRKYLMKEKRGEWGVAFLLCQASNEQPHLACFESKQGQNSAAIEREEPFSARNSREKQGHGHRCGVYFKRKHKLPQNSACGFQ